MVHHVSDRVGPGDDAALEGSHTSRVCALLRRIDSGGPSWADQRVVDVTSDDEVDLWETCVEATTGWTVGCALIIFAITGIINFSGTKNLSRAVQVGFVAENERSN